MDIGWIKVYRQIRSSWLWNSDEPYDRRSAWIDMLLCANHDGKTVCMDGKLMTVERGSFVTSQLKLAERWRWDRKKVKHFLELLEQDKMVAITTTTKRTTVTIENYGKYQDCGTSEHPTNGASLGQVLPTNKNDKNYITPLTPLAGGSDTKFETFWLSYPRKTGKGAARKSFAKVKVPLETLLSAVEAQKQTEQWKRNGGQYIPLPSTWLNQCRWEDEVQGAEQQAPPSPPKQYRQVEIDGEIFVEEIT